MGDIRRDAVRPIVAQDLVVARIREGDRVMAERVRIDAEVPFQPLLADVSCD